MTHHLAEETIIAPSQEVAEQILALESAVSPLPTKIPKDAVRSSLHASTLDGIFATIFTNITGGVLLSNFLVELNASALQIGLLTSIPMLANLLQPLGAYWADLTTSRRQYGLWVYGTSRLLWLPLAIAILVYSTHPVHPQPMIFATLSVLLATHVLGALGSASWLAWLATIVPRKLRGRYFGFRNSTFSLTSLIGIPLLGVVVSHWWGGSLQGFGVMVGVAVVAGLVSLGFQSRMVDVNPQAQLTAALEFQPEAIPEAIPEPALDSAEPTPNRLLQTPQFGIFLLYFGLWAFGANISNPFFNLYLLDNLNLDLSWVTLYNGLDAGANLLMLMLWGKLADRIGNRPILLLVGTGVAVIPLFWLATGANAVSIWLWFPLLHLVGGGTWAAVNLCINNLQLAIAPIQHHTKYFAFTAAIGGVSGAIGTTAGSWLLEWTGTGGMMQLFALSSVLRLVALLPLVWLREPRSHSTRQALQRLLQRFSAPAASDPMG